MNDIYEMMSTLRAVRKLRPDPIPDDVIEQVLQAAAWAPTGGNMQPWRVIVVRSEERKQALADVYRPAWYRYAKGYDARIEQLPEDEAAVSVCACSFAERPAETFVLVGSVLGLKSRARAPQGMVYVYSVTEGAHLTLLHKTPVDGVPRAICAFQVFAQSAMHTHADADRKDTHTH